MNQVVQILMNRDELTRQQAEEEVGFAMVRVKDGEDPEGVLWDLGLEPDYIFDIIP
jgi:ribosomal protein S18 acetylase RimI-like enzyme